MSRTCDAVVVGGGVIGCAVACELRKAGAGVILFERGRIGQEASSASAGMLTALLEADSENPFLRLCLKGRAAISGFLMELRERTGLEVASHQVGLIQLPGSTEDEARLRRRYAWQRSAGITVELLDPGALARLEPSLKTRFESSLYFPDEAFLNSGEYTNALAAWARILGAEIREEEVVTEILSSASGIEGVRTSRDRYHCAAVINAAGAWAGQVHPATAAAVPVAPVRGQLIALKPDRMPIEHLVFSGHSYLVPRRDGELLVGSTVEWAGFDKRNTAGSVAHLLHSAQNLLPVLESSTFQRAWSGLRPGTPDSWPVIGSDPECRGWTLATGHFRNGILLSALTATLVAKLVVRGESDDLAPFAPARFHGGAESAGGGPTRSNPECPNGRADVPRVLKSGT